MTIDLADRNELINDLGAWLRVICASLCVLSLYCSYKAMCVYQRFADTEHPGIALPSVFIVPWLAFCDMVNCATILLSLLSSSGVWSKISYHGELEIIQRTAITTQICYYLLHMLLALHILSMFGKLSRRVDKFACGYYGACASIAAVIMSYRLVVAMPGFGIFFYTVLPLLSFICIGLAALKAWQSEGGWIRMRIQMDNLGTETEANISLDNYTMYAKVTGCLHVLLHLPSLLLSPAWTGQKEYMWMLSFIVLVLGCVRGIYPLILAQVSPAKTLQTI